METAGNFFLQVLTALASTVEESIPPDSEKIDLLVLDDCSSDNSAQWLTNKKINFIRNKIRKGYVRNIKIGFNYILKHNINGVITPYHKTETMKYVLTKVPKLRIVHIEHHIDSNYFKNYNLKKRYDIFLFGLLILIIHLDKDLSLYY